MREDRKGELNLTGRSARYECFVFNEWVCLGVLLSMLDGDKHRLNLTWTDIARKEAEKPRLSVKRVYLWRRRGSGGRTFEPPLQLLPNQDFCCHNETEE